MMLFLSAREGPDFPPCFGGALLHPKALGSFMAIFCPTQQHPTQVAPGVNVGACDITCMTNDIIRQRGPSLHRLARQTEPQPSG